MNGTEQKNYTTALRRLADEFDRALVEEREVRVRSDKDVLMQASTYTNEECGTERTSRLRLADEQRRYVDGENRKLANLILFVTNQTTFLQRLRWTFLGSFIK